MNAVPFDTLKMAQRLEATGLDRQAAGAIARMILDTHSASASGACAKSAAGTPARTRLAFNLQLGGMFLLWVWAVLLGFSYLGA